MNIVIFTTLHRVDGGAGKIALSSAKALAKRNNRVILFTAVGPIDRRLLEAKDSKFRLKTCKSMKVNEGGVTKHRPKQ